MSNYYEREMNNIANQLHEMMMVDKVIDFYKDIYYGNHNEAKQIFANMMFLVNPQFDNPTEWVRKAITEFDTKDVYTLLRKERNWGAEVKCFFVKIYRTFAKDKRKKKLDPTITAEELYLKVAEMLKA